MSDTLPLQICELLITDILNYRYVYLEKLPSINELCEQYQVGRNTMRSALVLLEEKGFITNHRGTRSTVIFDVNLPESQIILKKAVYKRKNSIANIMEMLVWIMPELLEEVKKQSTQEQYDNIIKEIKNIQTFSKGVYDVRTFNHSLQKIIMDSVHLLNNETLNSLYDSLSRAIYIPLPYDNESNKNFSYIIKFASVALPHIASFTLSGNTAMMKKSVALLARTFAHFTTSFINRNCTNMQDVEFVDFKWNRRMLETQYMQLVVAITKDINEGKFNEYLPSMNQLANTYQVSLRTIRTSLDMMHSYHIIQKRNGTKSRIIVNHTNITQLMKEPDILANILQYKESFQIITIIAKGMSVPILNQYSSKSIKTYFNEEDIDKKGIHYKYITFLFTQTSNKVIKHIYEELKKSLVWNIYHDSLYQDNSINLNLQKQNEILKEAIFKHDYTNIYQCLDAIYNIVETAINKTLSA